MQQLTKCLPLALFISVFLTACNTNSPKNQENRPSDSQVQPDTSISSTEIDSLFNQLRSQKKPNPIDQYASQIKQAIAANMVDTTKYQGTSCTIRLSLQRNGVVEKATVEQGDSVVCHELVTIIKQAKIPPAPDEQTWQKFSNVPLDFRF